LDERVERAIRFAGSLKELAQFEANAQRLNALDDEARAAITARAAEFGREIISQRTGLKLIDLSPAQERIVQAIAIYVGLKGGNASRTLSQVKNRGLIGAAEASVATASPSQGYQTLVDEGREELSYEQIIIEHQEEFSQRAIWYSRRTLGLPNLTATPPVAGHDTAQGRTEKLLQWLKERREPDGRIPPFDYSEAASSIGWEDLRKYGRPMGNLVSRLDFACYRADLPPLGLVAQPSFEAAWDQEGRSWAYPRHEMETAARAHCWTVADLDLIQSEAAKLPGKATAAWHPEIAKREAAIKKWAMGFGSTEAPEPELETLETPYWVFVCNPKKWAIDKFLEARIELDSWAVRPSDQNRFGPGQLGIVRVGTDARTIAELDGRNRLDPGIYALCEVESVAYPSSGSSGEFWGEGKGREAGWPSVKLRYLKGFLDKPLTIAKLRELAPTVSRLLLDGFQAASFPIPKEDFLKVVELLGESLDQLPDTRDIDVQTPDAVGDIEKRYLEACPEVKERVSNFIERGAVGALVKKANGYKCQVCEALGLSPLGFKKKRDGVHYVEAHHVTPVSLRQVGSLAASNIMTVCPNHHRQLHYGDVTVSIATATFDLVIDGQAVTVRRPAT
jgi:hypothetical protein